MDVAKRIDLMTIRWPRIGYYIILLSKLCLLSSGQVCTEVFIELNKVVLYASLCLVMFILKKPTIRHLI